MLFAELKSRTNKMGDLLSAASLLVAITTVLYGLWSPRIKQVLDKPVPDHEAQRKKPLSELKRVLWGYSIPLTAATYLIALVFIKDATVVVIDSFNSYRTELLMALLKYNTVSTAFVLIIIFVIGIAIYLTVDCFKLFKKKKELAADVKEK